MALVKRRGFNCAAIGGMYGGGEYYKENRLSIIVGLVMCNVYPKLCDKLKGNVA